MSMEIVELSQLEIAERSQTLAAKIAEHDELDAEKKESAKSYAEGLKTLNREIRELSNVVRSGKEYKASKGLFEFSADADSSM